MVVRTRRGHGLLAWLLVAASAGCLPDRIRLVPRTDGAMDARTDGGADADAAPMNVDATAEVADTGTLDAPREDRQTQPPDALPERGIWYVFSSLRVEPTQTDPSRPTAYGFNLDAIPGYQSPPGLGGCGQQDFRSLPENPQDCTAVSATLTCVAPDAGSATCSPGQDGGVCYPAVDNGVATLLRQVGSARPEWDPTRSVQRAIDNMIRCRRLVYLLWVRNVDDASLTNDDDVLVSLFRGFVTSRPGGSADCWNPETMDLSFVTHVDDYIESNDLPVIRMTGRIVDHVLTTDVLPAPDPSAVIPFPMPVPGQTASVHTQISARYLRLRVRLDVDRGEGQLGGIVQASSLMLAYRADPTLAPFVNGSVPATLLPRFADYYNRSASGVPSCGSSSVTDAANGNFFGWFSFGYGFSMVRAGSPTPNRAGSANEAEPGSCSAVACP